LTNAGIVQWQGLSLPCVEEPYNVVNDKLWFLKACDISWFLIPRACRCHAM